MKNDKDFYLWEEYSCTSVFFHTLLLNAASLVFCLFVCLISILGIYKPWPTCCLEAMLSLLLTLQ